MHHKNATIKNLPHVYVVQLNVKKVQFVKYSRKQAGFAGI
jgi:hypothetical protein